MSELAQELFSALDDIVGARAARDGHGAVATWDPELWAALNEQGYASIDPAEPEVGLAEFCAVATAVGAQALGLPLVEAGLAAWMAASAGIKLPGGLAVPAVSTGEVLTVVDRDDDGLVVDGALRRVPWGRHAEVVLAFARHGDGTTSLVALEPQRMTEGSNFAGEPRDTVHVERQRVDAGQVSTDSALGPREARARGALLRAAAAAGAMDSVVDLVVEYAGQRHQFGQPIGSFQAIQQHVVTVAQAAAATRAAVEATFMAAPEHRVMTAAAAKVTLGIQAGRHARSAHQVFGAIGATEEHRLHLLTRRLWSWQDEYGTQHEWAHYLGDRLIFPEAPGLWEVLTPPHPAVAAREVGESVPW
ncbi:acyl-CoA dehydrogenase family protein [Aeromicrobium choanae]|uniref:Acyl-CoA dehydrogenase n=1 Tax=Aeromicrobium choanae TaxID=1736691 RepID=A0A1T4Z5W3_9ACTN|nr:acyl-CoA dehydrogenase family protein [Aeromicrobium choanae]SKB09432.1 acyl-CoA dehydrogenase [Aeromicrobium choanae]